MKAEGLSQFVYGFKFEETDGWMGSDEGWGGGPKEKNESLNRSAIKIFDNKVCSYKKLN